MADILIFVKKIKEHKFSSKQLEIIIREAKQELIVQQKIDKLLTSKPQ